MFNSEQNKQNQRVSCKDISRLPNEINKSVTVIIEILVQYSFNTHDYKNTKMTESSSMTYHPSSIRESNIDFRNLVDNLEHVKVTMKQKI